MLLVIILLLLINFRRVSVTKYVFGIVTILYLVPTYIVIMLIYSICNISDITWGNRPDKTDVMHLTALQRRIDEKYRAYRTKVLIYWLILNLLVSEPIKAYAAAQADKGG